MHWKRNLFKVPSGKAGKAFTRELSRMFSAYAERSALESVAMKAAMTMPALLLQKPNAKSKAKEHTSHLERRLKLWLDGKLDELLYEGRTIQQRLTRRMPPQQKSDDQTARTFAKLMMEGKVRAALRLVTEGNNGGPLPLHHPVNTCDPNSTHTVYDTLLEKHLPKRPAKRSAILTPTRPPDQPHPVLFDGIDGEIVRDTILKMDGAAGPSGLDAASWKRLCTSFKGASTDLCESLAATARRLCSSYVDPHGLSAFVACRLIALDKCPGVRPIGIGETARRLMGKVIAKFLCDDIQEAAGPLQLCAGHKSGCESAVHAMRQVFESSETEAVILVDATNAFNSLNRQAALLNIRHLCPPLSKILINRYREDAHLFIDGEMIMSQEGTTQGDPLAMAMYAIAVNPLICQLKRNSMKQIWFADDATAGGKLADIREWWDQLVKVGPDYGYFPNASKTCLIVKEGLEDQATSAFDGTQVSITSEGKKYLGSALGTETFTEEYVRQKVATWVNDLEHLSSIAISQPQAAYAAFTHGLTSRWTYLARTTPNIETLLKPLEETIRKVFLPNLTGQVSFNDIMRDLLALPARLGGLGIFDPCKKSTRHYSSCETISEPLVGLILDQAEALTPEVIADQERMRKNARKVSRQYETRSANELKENLPNKLLKTHTVCSEKGASSWLTVLPISEHGFALHKGAFRDALCLRYGWRPSHLPSHCVCGHGFTIEHALSCPRGGFPSIRHNEIRNITADLLNEVCHSVGIEPSLQPVTGEQFEHRTAIRDDGARLDIVAQSFWGRDRQSAFFDVRVFNPHAPCYRNSSLAQCYRKNELEKKRAYEERVREVEHGSFSPLVFSAAGGMGSIASIVYKRLASLLAEKRGNSYSSTLHWLRCRLNFSLLRSAIMCIRGSRSTFSTTPPTESIDLALHEGQVPTF